PMLARPQNGSDHVFGKYIRGKCNRIGRVTRVTKRCNGYEEDRLRWARSKCRWYCTSHQQRKYADRNLARDWNRDAALDKKLGQSSADKIPNIRSDKRNPGCRGDLFQSEVVRSTEIFREPKHVKVPDGIHENF